MTSIRTAKKVTVNALFHTLDQQVVQALQDDLEMAGWGVPIHTRIRNGETTLTYQLEVEV